MGELVAGRYQVIRELGRGAMAQVLLARQLNLGRLVVLKRVLPESSERQAAALVDEARVAARLHHPCIVGVIDVHPDGESVVIAMEYVPGVTLRDMIARAAVGLPTEVALTIALDLLRGLAYAHGVRHGAHAGIVHRDVKPRNIVVTFAGDTKLIDFGISRWLSDDGAWDATSISGTFGYMPPEQERGGRVDARVDQYALGVTLREMLTGQSPSQRGHSAPTRPDRTPPAKPEIVLDPEIDAILARATAEQPEDRYAGCGELATALSDYAKERSLVLSPTQVERWLIDRMQDRVSAWEREAERESHPSVDVPAALQVEDSPTEHTASPPVETTEEPVRVPTTARGVKTAPVARSSRRGRWLAIGLVAAAAAGAAAWFMFRRTATTIEEPRTIRLTVAGGSADDAWLGLAAQHLVVHALRDATPRAVWVTRIGDTQPSIPVELAVTKTNELVRLEARRAGTTIARAEATSVVDAADKLAVELGHALGAGKPTLGPDEVEAADMKAIGARSFDEYRRYRSLAERARISTSIDIGELTETLREIEREDPTWPRVYAERYFLSGSYGHTPEAAQVLADAKAHADAARDPAGVEAMEVLAAVADGRAEEAVKRIEPLFKAHDHDILVGETLAAALSGAGRSDDFRAVFRRLQEGHSELYFAANVASELEMQGRDDEAEQMLAAFVARSPENLTATASLVHFEVKRGALADARRDARRLHVIWGDRPIALGNLFDVMLRTEDLAEAQRIADKMLLGSPMMRGDGRTGAAVIAVLEGRFSAAVKLAKQALEDYRTAGAHPDLAECQQILRDLGDPDTVRAALDALAGWIPKEVDPTPAAVFGFEKALLDRGTTCPAIAPFLEGLSGTSLEIARHEITRAAAAAGCVPCKDVVELGLQESEPAAGSLTAFGRCARDTGDLDLARRVFEEVATRWSTDESAAYYSVLAHYHLATVLAAMGKRDEARAEYERFLGYWGHADRMLPEIEQARRAVAQKP